jgi:hypothetical protein
LLVASYLICLAPVITLPVSLFDTQGERFLYLPSAFACLLLVYLVADLIPSLRQRTAAILALVVVQATALQWVNRRWIRAAYLSRQIATEVSRADPAKTVILNLPDNFRGAYVFRNGLTEAATTFMGIQQQAPYRVICMHDMNALDDTFEVVREEDGTATLVLPRGVRLRQWGIDSCGLTIEGKHNMLAVSDGPMAKLKDGVLLSFRSGSMRPMLRAVEVRAETDSTKDGPSTAPSYDARERSKGGPW